MFSTIVVFVIAQAMRNVLFVMGVEKQFVRRAGVKDIWFVRLVKEQEALIKNIQKQWMQENAHLVMVREGLELCVMSVMVRAKLR